MGFLEWATSPWGQLVPIHIAWFLIWVAVIAGFLFFIVRAAFLRYFAKPKEFSGTISPAAAARIPEHVPRHSLTARLFHWIMAASMFTLLFTAFLPTVGVQFPLVKNRYHGAIIAAGLSAIITGVFMMFRVRTIFFPRNPYLFSDMTWGMMYVLHGLAGVGLIALIMVHVYFGLRPEKRPITKSMIFGWMSRDFYLKEHDPKRWVVETSSSPSSSASNSKGLEGRGLTDAV